MAGIDISYETVQAAQGRARRKGLKFMPVVGDLEALPFRQNTFDVCFCGWTLHHFPDLDPVIASLKRVLKPGGRIALVEPNESNPAMRLSRFVEDFPIVRNWILRTGWDTPNRTVHKHRAYIEALKRGGFVELSLNSAFPGSLPPLRIMPEEGGPRPRGRRLMHALFHLRALIFRVAARVLPRPLNGTDLLITGIRKD